jgi:AGZA family xanthine/uracil permease-like MFS transporter
MVFFVLGPAFIAAKASGLDETAAATHAWHVGMAAIFASGLFKMVCAFGSHQFRTLIPRAGLLGSLTAVALVLISFMPLLEILHHPVVGMVALAIILTTLIARAPLPFRMPGALGALLVAGCLFYGMKIVSGVPVAEIFSTAHADFQPAAGLWPTEWLAAWRFEWLSVLFSREFVNYLPIILPFALGTVVGGIDCTESAAAAGDEYDTQQVIGVEAIATIIAALCGGVIQTTPYIGHPAYKAMGGRAAYVLATALFVGSAGLLGYFGFLYLVIPKAAVFPILIFVGLEITAQSFHATPKRHYTAVALSCGPALGYLVMIHIDQLSAVIDWSKLSTARLDELRTIRMLSAGFIVTSLIWASGLAAIVDRHFYRAAAFFAVGAVATLFGVMHSPFPGSPVFLPWSLEPEQQRELHAILHFAGGYFAVAVVMIAWGGWLRASGVAMAEEVGD